LSPGQTTFTVSSIFQPVNYATTDINASITSGPLVIQGLWVTTYAVVPNATFFQIIVTGSQDSPSFLWRYISGIPFIETGPTITTVTRWQVEVPSGTILSQVYDPTGASTPLSQIPSTDGPPGYTTYTIFNTDILIFESTLFVPASVAITAIAIV